jgi:dolichol-phosphate mannosyltransferase
MGINKASSKKISIIIPSFNEQDNVSVLFKKIKSVLPYANLEVIFVDDGSSDGTLENIIKLSKTERCVKYISFSRNFGHQAALRAGLRAARGDAVISMDADLQHPPELLPILISKWERGHDIVYTKRDDDSAEKTSLFKKKSSNIFYKLINQLSGLSIDPGAADFRLLDRKVVDVINSFTEPNIFLRGLVNWIGFKSASIDYVPDRKSVV